MSNRRPRIGRRSGYDGAMMPITADRLGRVPVFPLPEVCLFPGTLLPLHIFEPRYVQMLEHCMQADRILAISCLEPPYEAEPPAMRPIMGIGQILAARETEQATWNIIVRGIARVGLEFEHPQAHLFREIAVRRMDDLPSLPEDPRYPRLRKLLAQVAAVAEPTRKPLDLMLENAADADALVHLIGAHLIADARVKRQLLECCDGAARLDIACAHVSRLLLEIGTRAETTTLH